MAKQVLIVENETVLAANIERRLQELGHEVLAVTGSGEEAIQIAAQSSLDLVVMDIGLNNGIDGVDVAKEIHSRFDTPVVFLTPYEDEGSLNKAGIPSQFGYLLKSFNQRELQVIIESTLYKHRMEKVLVRLNREQALLNKTTVAFNSSLKLDEVLVTVLEETRSLLDVQSCSIWLVVSETGELVCRHATGPKGNKMRGWRLKPGSGIAQWTVRNSQSVMVADLQNDERHCSDVEDETGLPLRSILSVPLQVKEQIIGVLQAVDTDVDCFTVDDLVLLEHLAASAAIAIENARLFAQAQKEIIERKRMEAKVVHSATHDTLTGLPNRALLLDRLQHVIERAKRQKNNLYAVLFFDLDGFKAVNDSLGHHAGDKLLIEIASRLTAQLRSQDTVARLGGDEFLILLEDLQNPAQATAIADRIQQDLFLPYDLDGRTAYVYASIGIVLSTDGYEHPDDILRDADIAMYHAKRQGSGKYEIFDPEMLVQVMTQREKEEGLRNAVDNNEFTLYYQPIRSLSSRRIVGFEALVRWQHPTRGILLPEEFISNAEENGLIIPIGDWVLNEACRQLHDWHRQFPADPPLTMSVNLSIQQFVHVDFAKKIVDVCRKNKVDPSCLKLELTESLLVKDPKSTSVILTELRESGIDVQIDDFGTGYSSLSYLQTLPIDTLKIDRVFISRLGNTKKGSHILRTILALARNLNMKVVAEGVETEEQAAELLIMGCGLVQGFLFGRPCDGQETGALLRTVTDSFGS